MTVLVSTYIGHPHSLWSFPTYGNSGDANGDLVVEKDPAKVKLGCEAEGY